MKIYHALLGNVWARKFVEQHRHQGQACFSWRIQTTWWSETQ